jgi:hypothetical protein
MIAIERYSGVRPIYSGGAARGAAELPRIGMAKVSDKLAVMGRPLTIGVARALMGKDKFQLHWTGFPQSYLEFPNDYPGRDFLRYVRPDDAKPLIDRLFSRTGRRLRLPTFEEAEQYLEPIVCDKLLSRPDRIEMICTSSMVDAGKYRDHLGIVYHRGDREAYSRPGYSGAWISHDRGWGTVLWLVEDLKPNRAVL